MRTLNPMPRMSCHQWNEICETYLTNSFEGSVKRCEKNMWSNAAFVIEVRKKNSSPRILSTSVPQSLLEFLSKFGFNEILIVTVDKIVEIFLSKN